MSIFNVLSQNDRVILDFVGANVAKKLHAGHMRNLNIGESLRRILTLKYPNLVADNHWGDWGVNIGVLIWGWKMEGKLSNYQQNPIEELSRVYVWSNSQKEIVADWEKLVRDEFVKLEQKDEQNYTLWQDFIVATKNNLKLDLDLMNVQPLELEQGESFYEKDVQILWDFLEKYQIWESEGSARFFDFTKIAENLENSLTNNETSKLENLQNITLKNTKSIEAKSSQKVQTQTETQKNWQKLENPESTFTDCAKLTNQTLENSPNQDQNPPKNQPKTEFEIKKPKINSQTEKIKKLKNLGRCYLVSSSGYTSYAFRDIAARIQWTQDLDASLMITITGNEQIHHFEQVFAICEYLSGLLEFVEFFGKVVLRLKSENLVHIPYGFLTLSTGKMSSRKGNVLTIRELFDQVQLVALENLRQKNLIKERTNNLTDKTESLELLQSLEAEKAKNSTKELAKMEIDNWKTETREIEEQILDQNNQNSKNLGKQVKTFLKTTQNSQINSQALPKEVEIILETQKISETKNLENTKTEKNNSEKYLESEIQNSQNLAKSETELKSSKLSEEELELRSQKITLAALKWYDLNRGANENLVLNIAEILNFVGNTGVYQLYTFARINSILKKCQPKTNKTSQNEDLQTGNLENLDTKMEKIGIIQKIKSQKSKNQEFETNESVFINQENNQNNLSICANLEPKNDLTSRVINLQADKIDWKTLNLEEKIILKKLYLTEIMLDKICQNFKPHLLCNHLFELCTLINSWYGNNSVSGENYPKRRQTLVVFCAKIRLYLSESLHLLGIEVLEDL